jgi:hypothetical protein
MYLGRILALRINDNEVHCDRLPAIPELNRECSGAVGIDGISAAGRRMGKFGHKRSADYNGVDLR